MGALSRFDWSVARSWPGWAAKVVFQDGSINGGDWERVVLLDQWFWRKRSAETAAQGAIENALSRKELWRVSEGGQSPVANNYSVFPDIRLVTPKERRLAALSARLDAQENKP